MRTLYDMFPLLLLVFLILLLILLLLMEVLYSKTGCMNPLSIFHIYQHVEGNYVSKETFISLIEEACVRNQACMIRCLNREHINRAYMLDHSRTLYLSQTELVVYGIKYRIDYFSYAKYLSFIKSLKHDEIMTALDFLHRFKIRMK